METTIQEDAVGWRGWERTHGEACSGFCLWPPHTLSLQVEMYSSSIYKQIFFLLLPSLHRTSLAWPLAPQREPWAAVPVGGSVVGGSGVKRFSFLSSVPGEGWSCSESSLVWEDYIWFLFLLFWITILPIPSCLPLLLNVYNNYTETATNLYIVFGSNSMRRWGTIKIWGSYSPLLCKFKSGGWGRGIVKMFTKL